MDRNAYEMSSQEIFWVALRKESVDRNRRCVLSGKCCWSLSARRAWIEILVGMGEMNNHMSLSARRAWIEIAVLEFMPLADPGRSPQGERG